MTSVRTRSLLGGFLAAPALLGTLTACGSGDATEAISHDVEAGDRTCTVDDTALAAGRHAFRIQNVGSDVTEVYVYGKNGEKFSKIIGERENIGPGTTQTLELDLAAGDYQLACKPGMVGDGIRTALSVTGAGGHTEAAEGYDRELEFVVTRNGTVRSPADLGGSRGERIEFKLENRSAAEHYLELLGPDGTELGEGEAHAGDDAEFIAPLTDAGAYQVKVFRDGHEDAATTLPFKVGK
ncbi:cupredoxin domain-containing protein [Nocardioides terrisoli]|uniref:cupredoxin domain-containing protein n=1 Tax=Nocardioides terrisoli TaxID=3388267 RepID=UPI00287B93AB|nr:cupredoxin domain-containing protein [Nocardioides marmorisolisilvae]